ncbi:PadR family transcriptional regulator [Marinitoga aeolica]|uniref:PadR family transcriptional regulator n=1 Tax=Marinitoga aeolica TaxID=2809031 RepID=A0ABY8PQN4_9BACT|nr:PadR family transcriptional regulator [Marinitoga aeolica]WGS64954.1 PadR family transcriptional regulator [Marinitoga aeolica]
MKKKCPRFKSADLLSGYLLLFLKDNPTHGYSLISKLKELGFEINEPTIIYRHLKKMENFGFIYSKIMPSDEGPPKKVFFITDLGKVYLKEISENIKNRVKVLNIFLEKYERSAEDENSNSVN